MEWPSEWSGMGVQQGWPQNFTDALGWGLLAALLFLVPLIVLFSRTVRVRCFWCAQSRRDVEVEFEEHGLPGFRRTVAVRSCSVFAPPTAVRCRRRCLDAAFRSQWEPVLPILRRDGEPAEPSGER